MSLPEFKKCLAHSIAKVSRNIHFLTHFHYFQHYMRCVIFQINADFLTHQLQKSFYVRDLTTFISQKVVLSIPEVSRIIHFLPHFY